MLVSVYMPTRNRVELLGDAMDSVLAQTHSDLELIVVNDASTDGTEEYLHNRTKDEPRLTYLSNSEPRGAAVSRNMAILKSSGAFVTGLDDDDRFLSGRIGAFIEYWKILTSNGLTPSCLYAQDIMLRSGAQDRLSQKRGSVAADDLFESNYIGNQIFAPRSHFIEAGLFDEQLPAWQDLDFWMRLLLRFGRAHLLDMPTYLFDVTPNPNRISLQEQKIRQAFEIVMRKYASNLTCDKKKTLFLQMFQVDYEISPSASDFIRVLRWGEWPKGLYRLLRSMNRTRQRRVSRYRRSRKE